MNSRTGASWSCCTLMMKRFGAFSASESCQRSSRSVRTNVSSNSAIKPEAERGNLRDRGARAAPDVRQPVAQAAAQARAHLAHDEDQQPRPAGRAPATCRRCRRASRWRASAIRPSTTAVRRGPRVPRHRRSMHSVRSDPGRAATRAAPARDAMRAPAARRTRSARRGRPRSPATRATRPAGGIDNGRARARAIRRSPIAARTAIATPTVHAINPSHSNSPRCTATSVRWLRAEAAHHRAAVEMPRAVATRGHRDRDRREDDGDQRRQPEEAPGAIERRTHFRPRVLDRFEALPAAAVACARSSMKRATAGASPATTRR